MKTLLVAALSLIFSILGTASNEIESHPYLKIKIDNKQEISYPPGIGYVVENSSGESILNPSRLEALGSYIISEPVTLYIFTTWNDTPDVYELSEGKLSIGHSDKEYDPNTSYIYGTSKRGQKPYGSYVPNNYGAWEGDSNGVSITRARYYDYDEATGYDTSLEFSNGAIFYYRDGKALAYEKGKLLKITGKYLIETSTGIIKLSYNPMTKKLWWVFEKEN